MNKIHIEKNFGSGNADRPLFGRKMCAEKFPELYTDTSAKSILWKSWIMILASWKRSRIPFSTSLVHWKQLCDSWI